ncbi:MAG: monovalent cation/H(+) antiporter subunit G [Tissierellia bacterium]|jgi:multicomponent Na+:H+ antiporter subunit G|nr:monovalent cation/H(+) antiporter subunit G [Tissierellia bacterium]
MEMIRLVLMIIFMGLGIFVFGIATFGLFKFDYILNRIHVAAKCDTLASLLIIIGLMIYSGFSITTLKLLLVVIFLWLSNPVGTHLIGQTEVITNSDMENPYEEV